MRVIQQIIKIAWITDQEESQIDWEGSTRDKTEKVVWFLFIFFFLSLGSGMKSGSVGLLKTNAFLVWPNEIKTNKPPGCKFCHLLERSAEALVEGVWEEAWGSCLHRYQFHLTVTFRSTPFAVFHVISAFSVSQDRFQMFLIPLILSISLARTAHFTFAAIWNVKFVRLANYDGRR